jgi:hypothetical protein
LLRNVGELVRGAVLALCLLLLVVVFARNTRKAQARAVLVLVESDGAVLANSLVAAVCKHAGQTLEAWYLTVYVFVVPIGIFVLSGTAQFTSLGSFFSCRAS